LGEKSKKKKLQGGGGKLKGARQGKKKIHRKKKEKKVGETFLFLVSKTETAMKRCGACPFERLNSWAEGKTGNRQGTNPRTKEILVGRGRNIHLFALLVIDPPQSCRGGKNTWATRARKKKRPAFVLRGGTFVNIRERKGKKGLYPGEFSDAYRVNYSGKNVERRVKILYARSGGIRRFGRSGCGKRGNRKEA